jgi:hypothetical protein
MVLGYISVFKATAGGQSHSPRCRSVVHGHELCPNFRASPAPGPGLEFALNFLASRRACSGVSAVFAA